MLFIVELFHFTIFGRLSLCDRPSNQGLVSSHVFRGLNADYTLCKMCFFDFNIRTFWNVCLCIHGAKNMCEWTMMKKIWVAILWPKGKSQICEFFDFWFQQPIKMFPIQVYWTHKHFRIFSDEYSILSLKSYSCSCARDFDVNFKILHWPQFPVCFDAQNHSLFYRKDTEFVDKVCFIFRSWFKSSKLFNGDIWTDNTFCVQLSI